MNIVNINTKYVTLCNPIPIIPSTVLHNRFIRLVPYRIYISLLHY